MNTRMSKRKRLIYCVLSAVLAGVIIFSVAACAEIKITNPLGSDILLEINDVECSMGTGLLRLLEAREEYAGTDGEVLWIRTIGKTTLADYIKNAVRDEIFRYTAAEVMSRDLTVFITDEERNLAESNAKKLLDELYSKYDVGSYGITQNDAADLFLKRTYYRKVYEKLSENINMEISDSDTKVIEIHYVFIPFADGIEVAERIRNEIRGGSDFESVCSRYGYEPVLHETETRGNMPAAFENSAYALKDNEVSEIVETREGYYVIYCLEDYKVAESLANKNRILSNSKRERFQNAYEEFASSAKMRFNESEWDKYNISTME